MFTGIIEELGSIEKIENYRGIRCFTIKTEKISLDTEVGDSISVNGVCLTVTKLNKNNLSFEIMSETLKNTNLNDLKLQDKVNLERSLKLNDRISGHLVSGHVDCIGIIRNKSVRNGTAIFDIAIPETQSKYIVSKGSIAVDGISLTVAKIKGNVFSVNVIPHTLKVTALGFKGHSDKVNIEVDLIGKYVSSISREEGRNKLRR